MFRPLEAKYHFCGSFVAPSCGGNVNVWYSEEQQICGILIPAIFVCKTAGSYISDFMDSDIGFSFVRSFWHVM